MWSELLEVAGVACLAVFCAFLFGWQYALIPAGLFLLVAGVALDRGK